MGRERIRVEHHAGHGFAAQRLRHERPRPLETQPRPEAQRGDAPVAQRLAQPLGIVHPCEHQRGDLAGNLHLRGPGHAEGHRPGAHPQRGARAQPRGARVPGPPGQHERMAVAVFVRVPALGQIRRARRRAERHGSLDRSLRQSDIGHRQRAALRRPGGEMVPELRGVERHRQVRAQRRAQHPAAIGTEAGGDIHRHAARRAQRGELARCPIQRPREAGAEERVDQQLSRIGPERRRERRDPASLGPAPVIRQCIGRQALGIAERENRDLPAQIVQQPRDDEAVAAIVARPAEHRRAARRVREIGPVRQHRRHHAVSRPLHQLEPRHAAGLDLGRLDRAHLSGREQLRHRLTSGFRFADSMCRLMKLSANARNAVVSPRIRPRPRLSPRARRGLHGSTHDQGGSGT